MTVIFFVGMPGAGKTHLGKLLATVHALDHIDLDAWIETSEESTIAEIFEKHGEDHFRHLERHHLLNVIGSIRKDTIVSCGGGTPCFFDNMETMKAAGAVVYLDTEIDVLVGRLAGKKGRPLISGENALRSQLEALLAQRLPFYLGADQIVKNDEQVIEVLKKLISTCATKQ
jgi:shikimate kinase